MDLNGNKFEDKEDEEEEEDDDFDHSNIPDVRSLKLFFQNQPIIGFRPMADNRLETIKLQENTSDDIKPQLVNNSDKNVMNRSNRLIPRPPKVIQSCDIKVSPFLKSLVSNQCEKTDIQSMSSLPPVPKPRKSLQKKNVNYLDQNCNFNETKTNDMSSDVFKSYSDCDQRTYSLIESLTKEFKELNPNEGHNSRISLNYFSSKNDPNIEWKTSDTKEENCVQLTEQTLQESNELSDKFPDKQMRNKSKKPFKSFKSKLLSLRKMSSQSSEKRRLKKSQSKDLMTNQMKPIKPTRSPPEPPKLHFRPPAPLPPPEPNEDYYEDTLTMSYESDNRLTNGYELYNDSVESERIYCSLDNEDDEQNDSDIYEGIDDYDDGMRSDHTYICDNYYEDNSIDDFDSDCDRIYEVLPFERDLQTDSDSIASNSTISLDDNQNQLETNSDPKTKEMAKSEQKYDIFDRKRNLKAIKLKKKFNLSGDEIPVNAGIVKEDHKGSRYDLFVRKGETVLILRMEGNPPGKWLAKNERSKVGFVDLDNISFDAESVKCIIKTLATHKS